MQPEDIRAAARRLQREATLHLAEYGADTLTADILIVGPAALTGLDIQAENQRLRVFAENVRDNWGTLTGYELERDARAALGEPD